MRQGWIVLIAAVLAAGCGLSQDAKNSPQQTPAAAGRSVAVDRSPVVAWVNDSEISEDDVLRSIVDTLGADAVGRLPDQARAAIVESLVMSRAVAQRAERDLNADELLALDKKVAAFREQLLVKRYLRANADPQPVTEAMIREYYQDHPEKFGGGEEKIIEIVSATEATGSARSEVFAMIDEFARQPQWREFADGLKARGEAVTFARTVYKPDLLDRRLAQAIDRLGEGDISATVMINGVPHRVRVTEVRKRQARDLKDVRGEVRKFLLPDQVKKAVRQVSGVVLAEADIRYANRDKQSD